MFSCSSTSTKKTTTGVCFAKTTPTLLLCSRPFSFTFFIPIVLDETCLFFGQVGKPLHLVGVSWFAVAVAVAVVPMAPFPPSIHCSKKFQDQVVSSQDFLTPYKNATTTLGKTEVLLQGSFRLGFGIVDVFVCFWFLVLKVTGLCDAI